MVVVIVIVIVVVVVVLIVVVVVVVVIVPTPPRAGDAAHWTPALGKPSRRTERSRHAHWARLRRVRSGLSSISENNL